MIGTRLTFIHTCVETIVSLVDAVKDNNGGFPLITLNPEDVAGLESTYIQPDPGAKPLFLHLGSDGTEWIISVGPASGPTRPGRPIPPLAASALLHSGAPVLVHAAAPLAIAPFVAATPSTRDAHPW